MNDIALRRVRECWRCEIELYDNDRHTRYCPRCACDLANEPIDLEALSPEEKEFRRSWKAAIDLGKIFNNWAAGFLRLIAERAEADYSLVHEFVTEVMELSFSYIHRLMQEGILKESGIQYLRGVLNDCTLDILQECEKYEDIYRLTGQWTDFDQETKEEWLRGLGFTSKLLGFAPQKPREIEHKS